MLNKFLCVALLSIFSHTVIGDDTTRVSDQLSRAIVLDIEMLGDTSVKSLQKNDAALLVKFSKELRQQLKQNAVFNVIDDSQSMSLINQKSEKQFLHRCNGCELELGKQLGAQLVVVPWIFRMSILIQTLVIEIRDVETGRLLLKSPYNFRGNIDKAWQKTILFAVKDLQKTLQKDHQRVVPKGQKPVIRG